LWACGAAGSALPWHGRGHRFDPDQVHQSTQRLSGSAEKRDTLSIRWFSSCTLRDFPRSIQKNVYHPTLGLQLGWRQSLCINVHGRRDVAHQLSHHFDVFPIFSGALLTSLFAAGIKISQRQNSSVLTQPSYGQQIGQAVGQQVGQVGRRGHTAKPEHPADDRVGPGYRFFVRVDSLFCDVDRGTAL
jgi:hypothetical protein